MILSQERLVEGPERDRAPTHRRTTMIAAEIDIDLILSSSQSNAMIAMYAGRVLKRPGNSSLLADAEAAASPKSLTLLKPSR